MSYIIRCDCGIDVTGKTKDEVVANGIEHAREGHAMTITREQVLPLVEVVAE